MDIVQSSNRVVNSFPPLNNITPFTRVDGWSFLEVLESLRAKINEIIEAMGNCDQQGAHALEVQHAFYNQFKELITSHYRQWDTPVTPSGVGYGGLAIGTDSAAQVKTGELKSGFSGFTTIGRDAGKNATKLSMAVVIGDNAMSKGSGGDFNIAIGGYSLTNMDGGNRNIAIGTLAGHFMTTGYQNTLIGRDAGHGSRDMQRSIGIGYRALSCGNQPVGLSGSIENQTKLETQDSVAVGNNALGKINNHENTVIGSNAVAEAKNTNRNTVVGAYALQNFGREVSENGFAYDRTVVDGTYSQNGVVITVYAPGHKVIAGKYVNITFVGIGTKEAQWVKPLSVVNSDTFTIQSPVKQEVTGACTINYRETSTVKTLGRDITIVGAHAARRVTEMGNNVVMVGSDTGLDAVGAANTLLGSRAGGNLTTGAKNTIIGYNSGRSLLGGTVMDVQTNCTTVGHDAQISGNDQVQLGNPEQTVYCYGTVQTRSDARDKTDVKDTKLGLDFINNVRPVDYVWDMRDDYDNFKSDGSKKRKRVHHGVIAQEIVALRGKGYDFGGVQDHSVNGGSDILSVGYDELIAPLIKAVQELSAKNDALEKKISELM